MKTITQTTLQVNRETPPRAQELRPKALALTNSKQCGSLAKKYNKKSMAIPVLIIEDHCATVSSLVSVLSEHQILEILPPARTLAEADSVISHIRPTLLFFNVEMPDGNGIEYWESLRKHITWNVYVIFYASTDIYAVSALRAKVHDYLALPLSQDAVGAALQRFFAHCAEYFEKDDRHKMRMEKNTANTPLLVLDHLNGRVTLRSSDIVYFNYLAERKIWEVFCTNGKSYALRHGVNSAKILSVCSDFEQVHKSYIVNLMYLERIEENKCVMSVSFNNIADIQVSRLYRNALLERFVLL